MLQDDWSHQNIICKDYLPCDALTCGSIIYDKPNNKSFKNKIENIQYKACIAITGAIQGTS